jgi:hypothetical protein
MVVFGVVLMSFPIFHDPPRNSNLQIRSTSLIPGKNSLRNLSCAAYFPELCQKKLILRLAYTQEKENRLDGFSG